jgi:MFS family permease
LASSPHIEPSGETGAKPKPGTRGAAGVFAPLLHPIFCALLATAFASNVGTWMQDVGASWLMTSLAPSPLMVSLIQTAVNLPYFLLGLVAGALADIADRKRLLIVAQAWMLASAVALGILTVLHLTTPWILVGLSFSLGLGAALNGPAWQAIMPEMVAREEIRDAVTLNNMQFNLARGVGPVIGGAVVNAWGAGAAFLANAASFVGIISMLVSWRRERKKSMLPAERVLGGIRAGMRYVRHSPPLRAVLARSFTFAIGTSVLWAALPLVVRVDFHRDATGYGIVVAFFGLGAAGCGVALPRLLRAFSTDQIAIVGGIIFAAADFVIARAYDIHQLWIAVFLAGVAWVATTTMFNSAAQIALPSWVRARALSMYLLVLQGGLALGSVGWGYVASHTGIRNAFELAGLFLLLNVAIALRFSLRGAERFDPEPWVHWPMPQHYGEIPPEQGPVMISVEYRIDPSRAAEFEHAMRALEPIRRRDGAVMWGLFTDAKDPSRYVETFMSETWGEHLRQHYRPTVSDSDIELHARSFHIGSELPIVSHLISPARL